MHRKTLDTWRHEHVFLGAQHDRNERRTWFVVALTAAMMVAEIIGGTIYGSMALVADGWHMSTHAGALAIAGRPTVTRGVTRTTSVLRSAPASSGNSRDFRAR